MQLAVLPNLAAVPAGFDTGPRSIAAVKMLRLSVTDRCNYRCTYCMPVEGVPWLPKDDLLSFEEIAEVVRAAVGEHGIRRFKLTGGEPTVRHGLVDLVAMLRRIDGVDDLSMTTNGQRLVDLAGPLREAGLDRITISLDSLQPDRFKQITRTGDLAAVLRGLNRLADVGFGATKLNCVVMRGINDHELADFARLTLDRDLTVRFIEYMPLGDAAVGRGGGAKVEDRGLRIEDGTSPLAGFGDPRSSILDRPISPDESGPAGGCGAQDRGDVFVAEGQMRDAIEAQLGPLIAIDRDAEAGVGPAVPYRLQHGNARGRVGFISAMSAPFCGTCNRLRLTATGVLRSCLFEGGEVDVRGILREPTSPGVTRRQHLAHAMAECVRLKPDVHSARGKEPMSRIGG